MQELDLEMSHSPFVSIIIPTHNRRVVLERNLCALGNQTYPADWMEVLVVADGCTDGTVETLSQYEAAFTLRFLEQTQQGPAQARNYGASCARGSLLIFLDDDIEASPSLVSAHVKAHEQLPGCVAIGYLPLRLPKIDGFFDIELRGWWERMFQVMRQPGHRFTYRDLLTGNFSIETEMFQKIGGFNNTLWCHEDYELGIRLIKSGVPFFFAEQALGYHYEKTDLDRALERKYQEGIADVVIGLLHPELRRSLPLSRLRLSRSKSNRVLCNLVFRWPSTGKQFVTCLRWGLGPLEKLRFRWHWRYIVDKMLCYFYWLGVTKPLGSPQALDDFLKNCLSDSQGNDGEVEIDLREGLEAAERRLNEERPLGLRIRYGKELVGRILPEPGIERPRGCHLRQLLRNEFSGPFIKALILERAIDFGIDTDKLLSTYSLESTKPGVVPWDASVET